MSNAPDAFKSCPACGATWPAGRPHCLACGAVLTQVEPIPAEEMARRRAGSLDLRWLDAWGEKRVAKEGAELHPTAAPEPPEPREQQPAEGGLGAWLRSRLSGRRGT